MYTAQRVGASVLARSFGDPYNSGIDVLPAGRQAYRQKGLP